MRGPYSGKIIAGTWYVINDVGVRFTRLGEMEIHAELRSQKKGFPPLLLHPLIWQMDYGSACLPQCLRKGAMVSMGMGKIVVELFSEAISVTVCR